MLLATGTCCLDLPVAEKASHLCMKMITTFLADDSLQHDTYLPYLEEGTLPSLALCFPVPR